MNSLPLCASASAAVFRQRAMRLQGICQAVLSIWGSRIEYFVVLHWCQRNTRQMRTDPVDCVLPGFGGTPFFFLECKKRPPQQLCTREKIPSSLSGATLGEVVLAPKQHYFGPCTAGWAQGAVRKRWAQFFRAKIGHNVNKQQQQNTDFVARWETLNFRFRVGGKKIWKAKETQLWDGKKNIILFHWILFFFFFGILKSIMVSEINPPINWDSISIQIP